MLILTCKLGNEIINCYDGTHNKEQLKKWSSKKILLCPVCGKPYEYCHGKVKTPYFRHMDKAECEDKYSESETEEHLNGKRDLFEWIKKQKGVANAVLEGWIPETKQRPDIMFEYDCKKYVIEYQCSPIATEYVERHELYQTSGIIDIWICGTEKYLKQNMKKKFIQDYAYGFYLPTYKAMIPISNNYLYSKLKIDKYNFKYSDKNFVGLNLDDFKFDNKIYNTMIGDENIVLDKIKHRIKNKADNINKKNKYLNKQTSITLKKIGCILLNFSNNNWSFRIINKTIIAEPIIENSWLYGIDQYKRKNYKKINLNKLNYYDFKRCSYDIDFLKNLLYPIMEHNKKVLLEFKNDKVRVLEVQDN